MVGANESVAGDEMAGMPARFRRTVGIVTNRLLRLTAEDGYVGTPSSRVLPALAQRYQRVVVCMPLDMDRSRACALLGVAMDQVDVLPLPPFRTLREGLKHVVAIVTAYYRLCGAVDDILVRGMCPYVGALYACAWLRRRRICHWIIGDTIRVVLARREAGVVDVVAAVVYAWQHRQISRFGRWLTHGAFICNGQELCNLYRSPRTYATISSTISECDCYEREDTCQGDTVRLLFVGRVRPEKGLEYLLEAVSQLRSDKKVEVTIVGSPEGYGEYRTRLERMAADVGIGARLQWRGYIPHGARLFRCMREADIFVLPTLSEGTPRVLVEARASGLPVVATAVGGIPRTVIDGYDGLLVLPRNARALAEAIQRIVTDGELRRRLIRNGLVAARAATVGRFAELVTRAMGD